MITRPTHPPLVFAKQSSFFCRPRERGGPDEARLDSRLRLPAGRQAGIDKVSGLLRRSRWSLLAMTVGGLLAALPARAQFVPEACQGAADIKQCGLNELIGTFVTFTTILFSFAGAVALFFFVYGGILWLTSAGNEERIKKGKDVLIQTVIALIIIFTAVTLMNFAYDTLTKSSSTEQGVKTDAAPSPLSTAGACVCSCEGLLCGAAVGAFGEAARNWCAGRGGAYSADGPSCTLPGSEHVNEASCQQADRDARAASADYPVTLTCAWIPR